MQTRVINPDTDNRDPEMDEELADVLTAISVVAKRLARKLAALSRQGQEKHEKGEAHGQDE